MTSVGALLTRSPTQKATRLRKEIQRPSEFRKWTVSCVIFIWSAQQLICQARSRESADHHDPRVIPLIQIQFTGDNKLLLAVLYSLRRDSICLLLCFRKSHCRHVPLLSWSTKPPFRLPAADFFLKVITTFIMFRFILISDFAYFYKS